MQPKKVVSEGELFRSRLDQMLDMDHALVRLSQQINWASFDERFGSLYVDKVGRPGLSIRLLVGLTYLSRMYDLGDEAVVAMWVENPYWQYFCGCEYFQHHFPLDPSSLVRWRKRIGKDGVEFLLQQTLFTAQATGQLTERHLSKVNVDTTVQEKAVRYPTDSRLYHRMLERLVHAAQGAGIALRQSYVRVSKRALVMHGRYAHARQMKRAGKETKKLKTFLGRVVRDLRRKLPSPAGALAELLTLADRLLSQQRTDTKKLYSVHAPEVECLAKGKAHKKYEFGCKVSVATTSRDNWVVGIAALSGNPYDGHTLAQALAQVTRLTGWQPQEAFCDQGYRGHGYEGETRIEIVDRRKIQSRTKRKWRKRRAAIEPVIGHLKSDHRMDRNLLKGRLGDEINALLSGCGRNLKKLLGGLLWLCFRRDLPGLQSLLRRLRDRQSLHRHGRFAASTT
jgi:IS5 family transposase